MVMSHPDESLTNLELTGILTDHNGFTEITNKANR